MELNIQEHIDAMTGEICCTTLAEDCANSLYGRCADDREFDLAVDVAIKFENIII